MTVYENVQDYYSNVLKSNADLKTNTCCSTDDMPEHVKATLSQVHEEVLSRYYGCGLVVPEQLEGLRVLDLGCGSGRDCFLLSKLVGDEGLVVGVDMTPEQLDVARRHIDYHTRQFNYSEPNVAFYECHIEELDKLDLEPSSFDLVISNCVINLSPDKEAVLSQVHKLLKPGGELYFSDIYADRRIPETLKQDEVLYGECLSGAMYWNDFENIAKEFDFYDPRLVEDRPVDIVDAEQIKKVGNIKFYSAIYRLFKLDGLEPACEDYGQAVIYKGSLSHQPDYFLLDKHHKIETGRVFPVCGNTYKMLNETRFKKHFEFIGDTTTHFGIFDGCGKDLPFDNVSTTDSKAG